MKLNIVLSLAYCLFVFNATALHANQKNSNNYLTKLYYHRGNLGDKVILYFDQDPICNLLPQRPSKVNKESDLEFFIPHVSISREAQEDINKLKACQTHDYIITIAAVEAPIPGVKIIIHYKPDTVIFDSASCTAITMQKGLVFSFYNKSLLNTIKLKTDSMRRYTSNQQRSIMIDCGHGGFDCGKVGLLNIKEKDINLAVGTKVAELLRSKGYTVYLTRNKDAFVPLDGRTALAAHNNVDLLISIHANAAKSPDASGIETYWSPRSLLKKLSVTSYNTNDIMDAISLLDNSSRLLANTVHNHVIKNIQKQYPVRDRSIKESIAQVLIGTDIPSVLLEIGFLSNPTEAPRLRQPSYQTLVAYGICEGIEQFYANLTT